VISQPCDLDCSRPPAAGGTAFDRLNVTWRLVVFGKRGFAPDADVDTRDMTLFRTRWTTALWRGLRKRCPHCGEGRMFAGWSQRERCATCGLVFVRNPGDIWAFTIIGDRVPIGVMIVLLYFGIVRSRPVLGMTILVLLLALLLWTAPNRWGVGIALHYLSRVIWPEPADPIPPPPGGQHDH
jgi:uncharacterized protein (DUF983 family)